MELALYCPDCGYYEKESDTMGRRGDFYTSVSVGPLFGELLAFQFAEWLGGNAWSAECRNADCRSRRARRAVGGKDILNWLRLRRPALFEQMEYWIVEPSARRQEWQRETLREFAPRPDGSRTFARSRKIPCRAG